MDLCTNEPLDIILGPTTLTPHRLIGRFWTTVTPGLRRLGGYRLVYGVGLAHEGRFVVPPDNADDHRYTYHDDDLVWQDALPAKVPRSVTRASLPADSALAESCARLFGPDETALRIAAFPGFVPGWYCLALVSRHRDSPAWDGENERALDRALAHIHPRARRLVMVYQGGRKPLTPRQAACLDLVAQDRTYRAIAFALEIAPPTVETHIGQAQTRLKAKTRQEAVAYALISGQISLSGRGSASLPPDQD